MEENALERRIKKVEKYNVVENVYPKMLYTEYFLFMGTTRPAAWSTFSIEKIVAQPLDMLLTGFGFFDGNNPANPFIASKCCKRIPAL